MQKVKSHEQMLEYIEKERKKLETRKQKMHEMMSNNSYILWLQDFTNKYPKFTENDFLYNKHHLSEIDLENINNLYLFFDGICEYAKNNYIFPITDSDYLSFYQIKYNNIGYEIGSISGQGTIFFCEKIEENIEDFLDFNDIILNKKQLNTDYFNKRLLQLSSIISYYYEQGIPFNSIEKTVNDALWDIKINQEAKNFEKIKKIGKIQ